MPKVYLSPAYHKFNPCSIEGCDETTHNNLYLDVLETHLKACRIDFKRGPRRVPKSNENGTQLMQEAVAESNAWGADVHYVSHTNASGNTVGGGKARGYRPIIYTGSAKGKLLASCMMKRRAEVYDQPISLSQRTDLYEEHVFHDNPEDAKWFHEHLDDVARSAAKGLCDYFGIPYVAPKKETAVQGDTIYRVQVGAFKQKDNADAYLKKVQAAGFPDAYISTGK